jgi:hypothetical protein
LPFSAELSELVVGVWKIIAFYVIITGAAKVQGGFCAGGYVLIGFMGDHGFLHRNSSAEK